MSETVTATTFQWQMDADLKAALLEQQALQPFVIYFKSIQVPALRFVSPETQMMMDSGYLREKSFDAIIRNADLIALNVPQPQVKDTVKVLEDITNSGTQAHYTINDATYDTVGVSWQYRLALKV
jgi:hypothetical protein